jgi:hypothetical protein
MHHVTPPYQDEVVARRIDRPLSALTLGDVGRLDTVELRGDFAIAHTSLTRGWVAPAVVGRLPVQIEITEWSDCASELRIKPLTRHLRLRSGRYQRRYFAAAHRAADDVAARLRAGAARGVLAAALPDSLERSHRPQSEVIAARARLTSCSMRG